MCGRIYIFQIVMSNELEAMSLNFLLNLNHVVYGNAEPHVYSKIIEQCNHYCFLLQKPNEKCS